LKMLQSLFIWVVSSPQITTAQKIIKEELIRQTVLAGFIWKSKTIRYQTKLKILKTCIFSTALHACETWTMKKSDIKKLLAFEMYCHRRILNVNWMIRVTNVEIRRLSVKENIMKLIIKRKLGLFGHICRMDNSRKIKSVMTGVMEGAARKGRPCQEWIEYIEDW